MGFDGLPPHGFGVTLHVPGMTGYAGVQCQPALRA